MSDKAENPRAVAGDNSEPRNFTRDQLKSYIERLERIEEEKRSYAEDFRDVLAEAKGNGFDVKAIRAVLKLRKQDNDERREQQAVLDTYCHALGIEW
jgi:uncharacterized protein (UPF0335 family)